MAFIAEQYPDLAMGVWPRDGEPILLGPERMHDDIRVASTYVVSFIPPASGTIQITRGKITLRWSRDLYSTVILCMVRRNGTARTFQKSLPRIIEALHLLAV